MTEIQSAISYFTIPLYILVAAAFYRRGLWRSYPYFWIGIIVEAAAFIVTSLTSGIRGAYKVIYLFAQPVVAVLYVLMVLEVFRKVFAKFPGIARFAQRFILVSMVFALALAIASTAGESAKAAIASSPVLIYSIVLRAVTTALCVYLILVAAFLVWMPVPLAPNVIRHSVVFFFYFIGTTAVHYLLNINNKPLVQMANLAISLLTVTALVAWFFLMKPEGEIDRTGATAPSTPAGTILNRLESIIKKGSPPEE